MGLLKKLHANESAQVLPMFVMLIIILVGMIGLATDLGRIYVARAELGRSVDAAALAGAKQLPDIVTADAKARAYITENEPNATIDVNVYPNVPSQQVEVRATKTVPTIFMRLFGINTVKVNNDATAGFGIVPVDAVMAIDATGSMGASPCNGTHNNSGCPIYEAKNAATAFTNTLLPGNNTVVGVTAYRGCFNPSGTNAGCVTSTMVGALNGTAATVNSKISAIDSLGGTGTNVCGGLDKASSILFGAGSHSASNTIRVIVILTDGDTTYNNASYVSGAPGSPLAACRPVADATCPTGTASQCNPANSDTYLGTNCSAAGNGSVGSSNSGSNSEAHERQLDVKTKTRADALKTAGAEIYVVGFGVCGSEDNTLPKTAAGALTANYCGNIGNNNPDTVADQRLLKCIASSSNGTNDHYFRANTATDLPGIFSAIAQQIAFRLIK
jgi:hypothetical protein